MTDLLSELGDMSNRPFGIYQPHVKHVSDDRLTFILRFDNGYGAFVKLPGLVTAIAWRPNARSVHDFYDVAESINVDSTGFVGAFDIISQWGPPPTF